MSIFYLVHGSQKLDITPKIAIYRGWNDFQMKIHKILDHRDVKHYAWNDLELLLFFKRSVFYSEKIGLFLLNLL